MLDQLKKLKAIAAAICLLLIAVGYGITTVNKNKGPESTSLSSNLAQDPYIYTEKVQGVFNSRCIACHSCLDSPCQLNLQSYDGLMRGLKKENVYGGSRMTEIAPTRLYEDAQTTAQWHDLGFRSVMGDHQHKAMLIESLQLALGDRERPKKAVKDSRVCPTQEEKDVLKDKHELAMPYGLPSLNESERNSIFDWVSHGAPPPKSESPIVFSNEIRDQIKDWTRFLNQSDFKHQITSRYLFEHLYLAHFYFQNSPKEFLRLVRSSHSCERPVIISTRNPNDYPGTDAFFYCFVKLQGTVVSKTHIPYEIGAAKLAWLENNFINSAWQPTHYPSWDTDKAANPFITYKEMPIIARYRFLLEDSQYHVMTFIKGPVCNGSVAVDSIQEQFYVFFMNPSSDLMVKSSEYAEAVEQSLTLPGQFGDAIKLKQFQGDYNEMAKRRNSYRVVERAALEKYYAGGLSLNDIWNGDDSNDNAVLTVWRHNDNAAVLKGARGDISKSYFVLDYSTFERLVYNLVVNFDVFGNLEHQALTRRYMDFIRMDAENNYLNFLPEAQRSIVKHYWYSASELVQRKLTSKLTKLDEFKFANIRAIPFKNEKQSHIEFAQKILFERLNDKARGPDDSINWKRLKADVRTNDPIEASLRSIASIPNGKKGYSEYFPDLSYLIIGPLDNPQRLYSVIHNREHRNVSFMFFESLEFAKEEDSLSIEPGVYGSYPNQFFYVEPQNLETMLSDLRKVHSKDSYEDFYKTYAVDRMDPKIWKLYDFVNKEYVRLDPIQAGVVDLSRYDMK